MEVQTTEGDFEVYAVVHFDPKATIFGLFLFVVVASAFMNNTPVVAVMIPVFIRVAQKVGAAPRSQIQQWLEGNL